MPRYIIKLIDKNTQKEYFVEWSTVVDAPVGLLQENEIPPDRMERIKAKGTSSIIEGSAEEVISFNRAGPGECTLSYDEIVRFYCLDEKIDESHPCWKNRFKALQAVYEIKGGADKSDLDKILKDYPYEKNPVSG
jgi:hypothetical protein